MSNNSNLGFLCRDVAIKCPDRLAYIELNGDEVRQRTFGALDERMDQVASFLTSKGLGMGDRLAVAIGNRIEFVEVVFGAMRAGIVPVPLNVRLGRETLSYIMKDSGCKAVIIDPDCNPDIVNVSDNVGFDIKVSLDKSPVGWGAFEEELQRAPEFKGMPDLPAGFPAMQPYTSGSTGLPKGVILTHEGQLWFVKNYVEYLPKLFNEDTKGLIVVPLFHKNAMASAIKPLLLTGGTIVLMRQFEARTFIKALADYKCTYSTAVPTVYSLLLQERDLIKSLSFKELDYLIVGSAPCPPALIEDVEKTFGVRMVQGYGLTEGGPIVFAQSLDDDGAPAESCGRLLQGVEVRLLDDDNQEKMVGELWVRNPGIAKGYHNLPDVTAERIVDGWLSTGDLFRRDEEGNYYFLGRTDDLMISGGENIYPVEVEKILMRHPDVLNICVVSLPHETKGEVPGAIVVLTIGSELTKEGLKDFFLKEGPAYAHPRHILIVKDMPLSGTGKIDNKAARKMLIETMVTVKSNIN